MNINPAPESQRNPEHSRFESFKSPRERFASSEHDGMSSNTNPFEI